MSKIKITVYEKQRMGNYQIRVNRLDDLERFTNAYINGILAMISTKIVQASKMSVKENKRRWYIQEEHLDYLKKDKYIELVSAYVWSDNK